MRLLLVALAVSGAAAASWHLATRGEEPPEAVSAEFANREGERPLEERPVTSRVKRFYGLQTAVPDTVGYNERTAMYAIEDGGFRVRVMRRKVQASREEGVVLQQLPRGGLTRRVGWIVTIVVGVR
jgi:PASTA domain